MKRTSLLLLCLIVLACQYVRADENRNLQKMGDHVWSYVHVSPMTPARSFGANAGVVVGSKAALVVDTLTSAKEGQQLLADVRKVTKLPILWVVNTHYHLDHAWGNCVFTAEGAQIVAASPAPKLLAERGSYGLAHVDQHGLTKKDIEGTLLAPATVSFTGTMNIDLGGVIVELRSLPHGHCPDNLIVWVPSDKVLFSGDLLFTDCHPFMGESNVQGWLADLDVVASFNAKKIIPGHGSLADAKDIAEMKTYIKTFDENATRLAKGKHQKDAPELAQKLLKLLPAQGRNELPMMLEYNLRVKYLPQEKASP